VVPAVFAVQGRHAVSSVTDRFLSLSTSEDDCWIGIVDDDASIRLSLARMFRGNGIRTETFESAEEYLQRSMPNEPRCIVLDVHLGGLNGFELQARLAADGLLTPIIFITAHEICSAELARCPGACAYLRKPFDCDALIALVRPHLYLASTE
jgi:FixJ family two-component response regulator